MEMDCITDDGGPVGSSEPKSQGMMVDIVRVDLTSLTSKLISHLIACGHRAIAVIGYSSASAAGMHAIEGYRDALTQADIDFDPSLVWERRGREYPKMICEILDHPRKPTAIYCNTTTEHVAIISTLQALGKSVPDGIGYAGWSCPRAFRREYTALPEITSYDNYFQNVAHAAIQRIVDRMNDKSLPAEVIPVSLNMLIGQSCRRLP